jgi:hypothetical protein
MNTLSKSCNTQPSFAVIVDRCHVDLIPLTPPPFRKHCKDIMKAHLVNSPSSPMNAIVTAHPDGLPPSLPSLVDRPLVSIHPLVPSGAFFAVFDVANLSPVLGPGAGSAYHSQQDAVLPLRPGFFYQQL